MLCIRTFLLELSKYELRIKLARLVPEHDPSDYSIPITWTLEDGTTITCKETIMNTLKVGKRVRFTLGAPTDKFGNAAFVDGAYTVEALNPDVVDVTDLSSDGRNGYLVAKKTLLGLPSENVGNFKITADADLGDGVKTIETTFGVELVAGEATSFGALTLGVEEDIPAPPTEEPPTEEPPAEEPPAEENPPQ